MHGHKIKLNYETFTQHKFPKTLSEKDISTI